MSLRVILNADHNFDRLSLEQLSVTSTRGFVSLQQILKHPSTHPSLEGEDAFIVCFLISQGNPNKSIRKRVGLNLLIIRIELK